MSDIRVYRVVVLNLKPEGTLAWRERQPVVVAKSLARAAEIAERKWNTETEVVHGITCIAEAYDE